MLNRRTASLLLGLLVGSVVLSGCVFAGAEPAPGQPSSPTGYSNEGFPPPPAPAGR